MFDVPGDWINQVDVIPVLDQPPGMDARATPYIQHASRCGREEAPQEFPRSQQFEPTVRRHTQSVTLVDDVRVEVLDLCRQLWVRHVFEYDLH
ncbi:hypothetical protein M877_13910 [Streptomyces niveus NCIMB 11891]|nr:hypothetical protein M877_13910 [Streptomyces niveus NCIMB 11891]